MSKFLSKDGITYLWQKIINLVTFNRDLGWVEIDLTDSSEYDKDTWYLFVGDTALDANKKSRVQVHLLWEYSLNNQPAFAESSDGIASLDISIQGNSNFQGATVHEYYYAPYGNAFIHETDVSEYPIGMELDSPAVVTAAIPSNNNALAPVLVLRGGAVYNVKTNYETNWVMKDSTWTSNYSGVLGFNYQGNNGPTVFSDSWFDHIFAYTVNASIVEAATINGTASKAKALTTTSVGTSTQPVYFNSSGQPVATTYALNKTVPSTAVFTDTTYTADGTTLSLSGTKFSMKSGVATAGTMKGSTGTLTWGGTYYMPTANIDTYGRVTSYGTSSFVIPSLNSGKLTITNDSTTLGTYVTNQSSDSTIDIPIPSRIEVTELEEGTYTIQTSCPSNATGGELMAVVIGGLPMVLYYYNSKYYLGGCCTDTSVKEAFAGKIYSYNGVYYITTSNATIKELYSLPIAKYGTLGGTQPFYTNANVTAPSDASATAHSTAITVNARSTTSGKYYPIEASSTGLLFVNVPWTNTTYSVATTSTNGLFSAIDKQRLNAVCTSGFYTGTGTVTASTSTVAVGFNSRTYSASSATATTATKSITLPAATTSAAGVMTSTDKTKLDGIPYTASTERFSQLRIHDWNCISMTCPTGGDDNGFIFRFDGTYLHLFTTTDGGDSVSNTRAFYIDMIDSITIGYNVKASNWKILNTGYSEFTTVKQTTSSDQRNKENLRDFSGLEVIEQLGDVYQFEYKDTGETSYGLIAQNVQESPLASATGKVNEEDEDSLLYLNYLDPRFIAVSIKAIKELKAEIEELKAEIKQLKSNK